MFYNFWLDSYKCKYVILKISYRLNPFSKIILQRRTYVSKAHTRSFGSHITYHEYYCPRQHNCITVSHSNLSRLSRILRNRNLPLPRDLKPDNINIYTPTPVKPRDVPLSVTVQELSSRLILKFEGGLKPEYLMTHSEGLS